MMRRTVLALSLLSVAMLLVFLTATHNVLATDDGGQGQSGAQGQGEGQQGQQCGHQGDEVGPGSDVDDVTCQLEGEG